MFKDKRNWIAVVIALVVFMVISEVGTVGGPNSLASFMLINVFAMFIASVVGGFIARRHQFVTLWTAVFCVQTVFSYWSVFNVASGAQSLMSIIETNAGWTGLALLGAVVGAYAGVRLSKKHQATTPA